MFESFDGQGLLFLAKRLERGRFVWPQDSEGRVALSPAQAPGEPILTTGAVVRPRKERRTAKALRTQLVATGHKGSYSRGIEGGWRIVGHRRTNTVADRFPPRVRGSEAADQHPTQRGAVKPLCNILPVAGCVSRPADC